MSATITEPLLVTREQLDAAVAIVEQVAREMGIEIRIDARIDIAPETPSAPPVQLLVVAITKRFDGGFDAYDAFSLGCKRALRSARLYSPAIPLETLTTLGW